MDGAGQRMIQLRASRRLPGDAKRVWETITDWEGQRRWIPFTTVRVSTDRREGVGTRCTAFSGWQVGRRRVGLPDQFEVTRWQPPREVVVSRNEGLFTGDGTFTLQPVGAGTLVTLTERVATPLGGLGDAVLKIIGPLLTFGMHLALKRLDTVVVDADRHEAPGKRK